MPVQNARILPDPEEWARPGSQLRVNWASDYGLCGATRLVTQSSAAADSCGSAGKPMQLKPVLRVSRRLCERYLSQWQIRPPDRGWAGDFQRSSIRL